MEKQWFVLHTMTGQEMKVQKFIRSHASLQEMEELIGEVIIPTEKVSEVKQGVKRTLTRKFFPGYVLISLSLYDAEFKLSESVWHFIKGIQGVIGFVGGQHPVPLSEKEVAEILGQMEEKKDKVLPKVNFTMGDIVRIVDGAFESLTGKVEEIDPERGKLKLMAEVFGRATPIELEYSQVERT